MTEWWALGDIEWRENECTVEYSLQTESCLFRMPEACNYGNEADPGSGPSWNGNREPVTASRMRLPHTVRTKYGFIFYSSLSNVHNAVLNGSATDDRLLYRQRDKRPNFRTRSTAGVKNARNGREQVRD